MPATAYARSVKKTCERCDHVFRSKAECNLREKAMKRMRAVESDSVKSARKAKDKLHKACERALETRERTLQGQERNNAHGKHERVMRQCSVCNQNTSTITCTVAPRVWHFSAFHLVINWYDYPNHPTAGVFTFLLSITLFLLSLGGVDYSLPKH